MLVKCALPVAVVCVQAGFPSPADDFIDDPIDLNAWLVVRPESTFFLRVAGRSMEGAGIYGDDVLAVDRSLTARPGHVVVAVIHGELTVKHLRRRPDGLWLAASNGHPDIRIDEANPAEIWGVVVGVVRRLIAD